MERLERTDRYRYINRNDRGPGPERPRTGPERPWTGKMVNLTADGTVSITVLS